MLHGFILGILVYSLILTIFILYKDNSSYGMINELDVIMAGPITWILILILYLLKPLLKKIYKKNKEKPYVWKNKSEHYIKIVVKKIMTIYKKQYKNRKWTEYFDFQVRHHNYEYDYLNGISGYEDLIVHHWKNEFINKKFNALMYHQKDDTIKEIVKYCDEINDTNDIDTISDYVACQIKDKNLKIYTVRF